MVPKHRDLLLVLLLTAVIISGCVGASYEPNNTLSNNEVKRAYYRDVSNTLAEQESNLSYRINCAYTFLANDIDVTEYDGTNHLLKTEIINNGVSDTFLGSYRVWYENISTPSTWNITNPEDYNILKNSSRIIILNVGSGKLSKVKLSSYNCTGVTTTISEPYGGWVSKNISVADAIPAKRQQ